MKKWANIAFWIVVAGQLVFLLGFIAYKEVDLRTGTEVVLQTVPVDPRSLLQGDYAILDYQIASLPGYLEDLQGGQTVYVELYRLATQGPEVWWPRHYRLDRPSDTQVFVKGRVDRPGHLDFGIGTYFVPEGTGHIIEGAQDVKVVVSVDADGSAIIKGVLVDGQPFDPDAE